MTEIAWAAGFFDGEGNARLKIDKRPGRKACPYLTVVQTHIVPLERFKKAVGGGTIYERRVISGLSKKPQWRLEAWGDAAERIMRTLLPYLCIVKQQQIEPVLEAIATNQPRR